MTDRRRPRATGIALLLCAAATSFALAEEEKKLGSKDTAELSYVATAGNTESTSLGFRNTYEYVWDEALFTLKAGGIRVQSWAGTRIAVEENDGDIRVIDPDKETTAEAYSLNGRYDRQISKKLFWFVGAGWERNEFAGFDNRYIGEGGVGHNWYDTPELVFRTRYSVTYTKEDLIVEDPTKDDSFLGYRFAWNYLNKLGASTTFTNDLTLDGNADEGSAWRGDMDTGVAVSMSEHLALKVGLRFLYENDPKLQELALFDETGAALGTTLVELDELDTILTASLVVNFD
jgi:putative salt-induced outer membrane protein